MRADTLDVVTKRRGRAYFVLKAGSAEVPSPPQRPRASPNTVSFAPHEFGHLTGGIEVDVRIAKNVRRLSPADERTLGCIRESLLPLFS